MKPSKKFNELTSSFENRKNCLYNIAPIQNVASFMSASVVYRWYQRTQDKPSANIFETYIDEHYPNQRMEKIYANLEFKN